MANEKPEDQCEHCDQWAQQIMQRYLPYLERAGLATDHLDAFEVFGLAGKIMKDTALYQRALVVKDTALAALGRFTDQERAELRTRVGGKR